MNNLNLNLNPVSSGVLGNQNIMSMRGSFCHAYDQYYICLMLAFEYIN